MKENQPDHGFNQGYPSESKKLIENTELMGEAIFAAKSMYPKDERGQYLVIREFLGEITRKEQEELAIKERKQEKKLEDDYKKNHPNGEEEKK